MGRWKIVYNVAPETNITVHNVSSIKEVAGQILVYGGVGCELLAQFSKHQLIRGLERDDDAVNS